MAYDADGTGEVVLTGGERSVVTRRGDIVYREAGPWSATILALLRHLEREGIDFAPRVVGSGFDERGREMLSFVPGASVHPYPWGDEALPVIGDMLRRLHLAAATFVVPADAVWRPWFGREIGQSSVIGHCDMGAWNIIAQSGRPVALIDWEAAGPVDPMVELAQACWLNALLFDDDLKQTLGLGSVEARARQVRLLLDGYQLPVSQRAGFVARMRDFAILAAAEEAIEAKVTPETIDTRLLWAVTWRTRSAAWLVKHHDALERIVLGA